MKKGKMRWFFSFNQDCEFFRWEDSHENLDEAKRMAKIRLSELIEENEFGLFGESYYCYFVEMEQITTDMLAAFNFVSMDEYICEQEFMPEDIGIKEMLNLSSEDVADIEKQVRDFIVDLLEEKKGSTDIGYYYPHSEARKETIIFVGEKNKSDSLLGVLPKWSIAEGK